MKKLRSFLVLASVCMVLTGCPENNEDPNEPYEPEETVTDSEKDAGSTDGSVDGNVDGALDGDVFDSGGADGVVDGNVVDSGGTDGSTDGSSSDAGATTGSTNGELLDAGSADDIDEPVVDAGGQQATLSCATLDAVVWRWGGTSGPCGPQNSVTFHADGRIVESLQGSSPEGPDNTCVATQRHFEVFALDNQAFIQSVCEDYLSTHEADEGCVGAYSRWIFMEGDEALEQTGNLSCGNTSMATSAAAYQDLVDSLMAPNTCEYGCNSSADCLAGYRCQGAVSSGAVAKGQCLENGVTIPGEGENCDTSDGPCGEDLVCVGDLMGEGWGTPTCDPGWMGNAFFSNEAVVLPAPGSGETVVSTLAACGLATVPEGAIITLKTSGGLTADFEYSLVNPNGSITDLSEAFESLTTGITIRPPGDEDVNGLWTLSIKAPAVDGGIEDASSSSGITIQGWSLYLESRFD
ncbi:MAG: hypothetical protein CMH56_01140 [Myxococcales bacterium]|nr:hypothetical protein [Myxococcales bacterium]|tara:strand:- start:130 stop:1521 length:1392 start_codon:yes stop_codon:yes gene_type:complete